MPRYKRSTSYMSAKATDKRTGEAKFSTQAQANAGVATDVMISPAVLDAAVDSLIQPASTTVAGKIRIGTVAEQAAGILNTVVVTPVGLAAMAIAGAPDASEILRGILELSTQAETNTGTNDATAVTPLKLTTHLASPNPIGSVAPNTGAFTTLAATSAAGIELAATTASFFSTSGAGQDLTLESTLGRVILNGEEAAANAITLLSAAGGIDADAALQINIASSQNAANAIVIAATAGGIDITATGAAAEDLDLVCTSGSTNISGGEAIATAVTITAAAGGIDIASGGAGLDIDVTATGGSINLTATQNAADAIVINASAGGIDIGCTGTAGEDIDITATGSSVNLTSTENAAAAIYLRENGGVLGTIDIRADQGTDPASISLLSDVGGVTISGGLATSDAVNIITANAAGGIDVDAGTAGFIVDTTGGISLDAAAASNFTATGAFDITVQSTAGSILINAGEAVADAINIDAAVGGLDVDVALQMSLVSSQAAADAIVLDASNAAGGIDVDCGSGGLDILATAGAISIDAQLSSNLTVTGATENLTLASVGGSVYIDGSEAVANAVTLTASGGGLDITAAVNDVDIVATLASVNITANEAAADGIVVNSVGGGLDITAGVNDIDITATLASVNIVANEAATDAITLTSSAGGVTIDAVGAAMDVDVTATGGSINLVATEAAGDAIIINASDAASGMQLAAGTGGIDFASGLILEYIEVNTAAHSPYAVLGTDYYVGTDSTGGAFAVTLPAAPEVGRTYVIQDAVGQAAIGGAITITGTAGNIVAAGASAATCVLNTAYESVSLTWNGTVWLGRQVV